MDFETILFEKRDRVAVVTINRPKVLNALNQTVLDELEMVVDAIAEDPSVWGLVLTGSGEKAFVAGADITEFKGISVEEARKMSRRGQDLFARLENLPIPTIAVVNGFALGGGLELAMSCSFRYATPNAKVGQPEVKLGVIPGYAGTQRLPRLIGLGRAIEWLLTGNIMDAAEAYRIGLVNHVTSPEELIPTARKLAADILKVSPIAAGYTLEAACRGIEMPIADGQNLEATLFGLAISTADAKEGLSAFLEKRSANFQGK